MLPIVVVVGVGVGVGVEAFSAAALCSLAAIKIVVGLAAYRPALMMRRRLLAVLSLSLPLSTSLSCLWLFLSVSFVCLKFYDHPNVIVLLFNPQFPSHLRLPTSPPPPCWHALNLGCFR